MAIDKNTVVATAKLTKQNICVAVIMTSEVTATREEDYTEGEQD